MSWGWGLEPIPTATRQRLGRPDPIVFSQKLELSVLILTELEKVDARDLNAKNWRPVNSK